ncbi:MAG: hypothetical protein K0S80_1094 [Neobacillus sp.]|nr:hypothetical protein [Neobacillus sp.]
MCPESYFFIDLFNDDDSAPKMQDNRKLAMELYPEKYQQVYDMIERDPAGEIVEGWEKELDSKFPYPFEADEIAYWNNDKTNYLEGGDPDSYNIYYSLKLKDEQRKFDKLMESLKTKYNVSEEDIGEIKSTSENIVILTCGQYIHPGF